MRNTKYATRPFGLQELQEIAAINPSCFHEIVELCHDVQTEVHHASENCSKLSNEYDVICVTLLDAVAHHKLCDHCEIDLVKTATQETILDTAQKLASLETCVTKNLDNSQSNIRILCDLAGWPLATNWRNLQTCGWLLDDLNKIDAATELQEWKNRIEKSILTYLPEPVDRKLLDIELIQMAGIKVFQTLLAKTETHSNVYEELWGGEEAFGLFENCTERDFADDGWEEQPLTDLAQAWCEQLWKGKSVAIATEAILGDETVLMNAIGEPRGPWLRLHKLEQPLDTPAHWELAGRLWYQHALQAGRKALESWSEHYETLIADTPAVLMGWKMGILPAKHVDIAITESTGGRHITTFITESLNWTRHSKYRLIACHPIMCDLLTSVETRQNRVWRRAIRPANTPTQEELEATASLWEPDILDSPYWDIGKAFQAAKLL